MDEHHASKTKGLIWLSAACFVGAAFALGLSPIAHNIPWSWERHLGSVVAWDDPNEACLPNPRGEALLQQIVTRLYPMQPDDDKFSIEVKVAKSPIVNAYAALGGRITINTGLLKQAGSAEEVAGVLAHEIGHVHNRHIMQAVLTRLFTAAGMSMIFGSNSQAANWANYFMTMDFTRAQEAQADADGLGRLQKAHIDNAGFKRFFERMSEEGKGSAFLSDHPSNAARIEMVDNFPNQDVKPIMTAADWKILKKYCSE